MAKRLFDIIAALAGLIFLSPALLAAWAGIHLFDRGPAFYLSMRAGVDGTPFRMYKFRTMRSQPEPTSAITSAGDSRVFPFGHLLRVLKIDELPQLWNVLKGEMSVIGPRPEDCGIVEKHYSPEQMKTLNVAPGLSGPGSNYYYMFAWQFLGADNVERDYVEKLLPRKLALELAYVQNASFALDLRIIAQTVMVILRVALGQRDFGDADQVLAEQIRMITGAGE